MVVAFLSVRTALERGINPAYKQRSWVALPVEDRIVYANPPSLYGCVLLIPRGTPQQYMTAYPAVSYIRINFAIGSDHLFDRFL